MWNGIVNYFANFDDMTNACRTIALWITVVLALAFVITRLYMFALVKRGDGNTDALDQASRIVNGAWIIVALTVAVGFIVTFTVCYFAEAARSAAESGTEVVNPRLFYPLFIGALIAVGSGVALFVKPCKITKIVTAALCGGALIAALVCIGAYYESDEAGEVFAGAGLYVGAVAVAGAVVTAAAVCDRKSGPFDTRAITYAAVCVALSFALSYVRIFKMPMGGSITFASMLPVMLFAFMFGTRKGVVVGVIYGVLQAVQDPYIIHPAQFALDYIVAFGAVGLAGIVRDLGLFKDNIRARFALGAAIAVAVRFVSHYLAGVFAFGEYGKVFAGEYNISALANPYFYSFVYQCLYLIPELAIVLAVGMLAMSSSSFRRQVLSHSAAATKTAEKTNISG